MALILLGTFKMKWLMLAAVVLSVILLSLSAFLFINRNVENPLTTFGFSALGSALFDKPSPADWVQEKDILIYNDRVVILVPNATLSSYAFSKSMDPLLDGTANGIEIKPNSPEDIHVGDIIAYEKDGGLIVHRVIETGIDEQGWFCVTKGDNALQSDGKVRFNQIYAITIMIIY